MNATKTPLIRRSIAAVAVIALGFSACGSDDDSDDSGSGDSIEISIADPWSREPADGQSTSAVYGVVTNNTGETITAVSAATEVSTVVELHEVLMNDDGQMTMREKEGGYEIGDGESLTFEPGGPHIMLLDIDPATYPETVDVTLSFDTGASLDFTAEVRALDGGAMGDMDGEMEMEGEMDDEMEMDEG